MKLKNYISLLLLAVYMFAVGGRAFVSITCPCSASKTATEAVSCHHCQSEHCGHSHDNSAASDAKATLSASCTCGSHHSTEIDLYTGVQPGDDKNIRCFVTTLPPALVAEVADADAPVTGLEKAVERNLPPAGRDFVSPAGLRAPPVLA